MGGRMSVLTKTYGLVKSFLIKVNNRYFGTQIRRNELLSYFLISSFLSYMQVTESLPLNSRGFIGHVQSLVFILMAFRFGYLGLIITFLTISIEVVTIVQKLFDKFNNTWMLGLTLKVLSVIVVSFVAVLTTKQEIQKRKLERLAVTDELTDVYNQRFFHMILESEIEKAQKSKHSVGLIMIDIDNFKMYNDIYGHECGDSILKGTVLILKEIIKEESYICRYGGDEFAVIYTNTDLETLEYRANNLRQEFEQIKKDYYREDLYDKVTLSIGLSEYPNMSRGKNELIYQADMALYHAKNLGKDKVHLYHDVIMQIRKNISSDHQQLIGIFKGLLSTISVKDKYTHGHCERVSAYAVMIGEALGLNLKEISIIQYAGLLHDIGKIEMPKSILNKIEDLTEEEVNYIRLHPVYSENILEPLEEMDQLIDYVRHHHERYDGKGYPDGLIGEEISLGARILCVADSFDAMISDRPYSKGMTMEQAFRELEMHAGTQFDKEIVNIFIRIMKPKVA